MARVHDDANASQPVVVISGKVLTLCDQLSWTHNQLLALCHVRAAIIGTTRKTAVLPKGCFIKILDSSNSSSITSWTSQFRSNWTHNSNGNWTDQFSTVKEMSVKSYILFHVKATTKIFWNDAEKLLKSFWTSHLHMMNGLEPLF